MELTMVVTLEPYQVLAVKNGTQTGSSGVWTHHCPLMVPVSSWDMSTKNIEAQTGFSSPTAPLNKRPKSASFDATQAYT